MKSNMADILAAILNFIFKISNTIYKSSERKNYDEQNDVWFIGSILNTLRNIQIYVIKQLTIRLMQGK